MKKMLLWLGLLATLTSTHAATKSIEEPVAGWVFSHSVGSIDSFSSPPTFNAAGSGFIGATGSSCGSLTFDIRSTVDDLKIFRAYYLVAKATGVKMKVFYDDQASCAVVKFSLSN